MDPFFHVWLGDEGGTVEYAVPNAFLAVYAAGGGKRNMANYARTTAGLPYQPTDLYLHVTEPVPTAAPRSLQLLLCRYSSSRTTWTSQVLNLPPGPIKLVPEWFKARFWGGKQEKKQPWFMFSLLVTDLQTHTQHVFSSSAFPICQFYPTGPKRTDINDPQFFAFYLQLLKQCPSTLVRPDQLLASEWQAPPSALWQGAPPVTPVWPPVPLATAFPFRSPSVVSADSASDDGSAMSSPVSFMDSPMPKKAAAAAMAAAAAAAAAAADMDDEDDMQVHQAAMSLLMLSGMPLR